MTERPPTPAPPTAEVVDRLVGKLAKDAEQGGYHLNPDGAFTRDLAAGLAINSARYGYPSCPCRIGTGDADEDRDIVCPCDYRDADLDQFGACYCALYVSEEIAAGKKEARSIPERRPPGQERARRRAQAPAAPSPGPRGPLPYPVWRCQVCGYLCARDQPPEVCPVCKAKKDRFERFL